VLSVLIISYGQNRDILKSIYLSQMSCKKNGFIFYALFIDAIFEKYQYKSLVHNSKGNLVVAAGDSITLIFKNKEKKTLEILF